MRRPGRRFVSDLQAQVDSLRYMLSLHAPGVDVEAETERMKSGELSSSPPSALPRVDVEAEAEEPQIHPREATPADNDIGSIPDTFPLEFTLDPVETVVSNSTPPLPAPPVTADRPSPLRPFTASSSSPHATTSNGLAGPTRLGAARRAVSSTLSPGFSLAGSEAHPPVESVGPYDVLERNPVGAHGYEWNERYQPSLQMDGTASLSTDPEGEGYLGEFGLKLR